MHHSTPLSGQCVTGLAAITRQHPRYFAAISRFKVRADMARSVLHKRRPTMSRRARLTVLELGASATAWASSRGLGTDDWIVVAQQSDEPAPAFGERVRQRARRLSREDAQIESVDVYTAEAELADMLRQFGPILAERQIAMNHQNCEAEQRSGVRHAAPTPPRSAAIDFDFQDFG